MAANGGRKRESVALSPRTFEAQGTMAVTTDLQVPFSLFFLLLLPDIWTSVSWKSTTVFLQKRFIFVSFE